MSGMNGKGIPLGHSVNPSVIYTEAMGSIFLLMRLTGDAHGESDGSMTHDSSISPKVSFSA